MHERAWTSRLERFPKAWPRPLSTPSPLSVAPYVLRALSAANAPRHLDELSSVVEADRSLVRAAVTTLHRLGLVDALRMKLTPSGRRLADSVSAGRLPPLGWHLLGEGRLLSA
jgi:hypothetical protein